MFWARQDLKGSGKYPILPFLPPLNHISWGLPVRHSDQKVASFYSLPYYPGAELVLQELPGGTFLGHSSVPVPEASQVGVVS